MRNLIEVTGKLEVIEQLKSSRNGNPKYLISIGDTELETETDSSLTYLVKNYQAKTVTAKYRMLRNKPTLMELESQTV